MGSPLNSAQIKLALMKYLRYKRGFTAVASEVSMPHRSISDIMAYDKSKVIEVEIKCSISDMKQELTQILKRHHHHFIKTREVPVVNG